MERDAMDTKRMYARRAEPYSNQPARRDEADGRGETGHIIGGRSCRPSACQQTSASAASMVSDGNGVGARVTDHLRLDRTIALACLRLPVPLSLAEVA
jgi:hypothetical protein